MCNKYDASKAVVRPRNYASSPQVSSNTLPNPESHSQAPPERFPSQDPSEPPPYSSVAGYNGSSLSPKISESNVSDTGSIPPLPRAPTPDVQIRLLHLSKPIAIPATNSKLGFPFLRAYPPSLARYALPPEIFLRFVDDLNRVAVANPPLQVLDLAGAVTGMVPLATAQIVGNAVSLAAKVGTVAVSKGSTEMYMRQANTDIFAPRGLKVEIAKLAALARIANIPILDAEGKIDKNSQLLANAGVEELNAISGQDRRLTALSQYIEPLDLTPLPMIQEQKNPLSRLNQAASERQRKKGEEKLVKEREKAYEESRKVDREYQKELEKQDKEEERARRKNHRAKPEEELDKIAKERRKIEKEYEKERGKLVKDDDEEKAFRKILWLVI